MYTTIVCSSYSYSTNQSIAVPFSSPLPLLIYLISIHPALIMSTQCDTSVAVFFFFSRTVCLYVCVCLCVSDIINESL